MSIYFGTQKFERCATYATAYRRNPWAAKVCKVEGGFLCFEYTHDYERFKNQK